MLCPANVHVEQRRTDDDHDNEDNGFGYPFYSNH